jgi:DNA-binding CsgD family transcriptional regulator
MGLDELTPREREIYDLAARGLTNREIATSLFIQETTVKSHMSRVLAKMGASSRSALIAGARLNGEPRVERDVSEGSRPLVVIASLALIYPAFSIIPFGPDAIGETYWHVTQHAWTVLLLSLGVLIAGLRRNWSVVLVLGSAQLALVAVATAVLFVRPPAGLSFPGTLFLSAPVPAVLHGVVAILFIALAYRAKRAGRALQSNSLAIS